jgi:hypothetical protein
MPSAVQQTLAQQQQQQQSMQQLHTQVTPGQARQLPQVTGSPLFGCHEVEG